MSEDKKWLIKSSDTILGPYEFDHVVENIFAGDIHILDEIKGPFDRWHPIKNHSLFAAAIEEFKAKTFNRRQGQREQTMTATVKINTSSEEDMTESLVGPTFPPPATPPNTPPASSDPPSPSPSSIPPVSPTPSKQKIDWSLDEKSSKKEKNKKLRREFPKKRIKKTSFEPRPEPPKKSPLRKSSFVWGFAIVFILIVGLGYQFYQHQKTLEVERKRSMYDRLVKEARKAVQVGDHREALEKFTKASNLLSGDSNLIIEMAPLSVQLEVQYPKVQRQMEKLISRNKIFLKRGKNIIGMTYSYRDRYREALRFYDDVIQGHNQFLPAVVNKAFALLKLGRSKELTALMEKAMRDFSNKPIVHYLYVRSLLEMALKRGDKPSFEKVLLTAEPFSRIFFEFRQEVLFLMAVTAMKMGLQGEELAVPVRNFLKVDMELTNLHVKDSHIDFRSFNWKDYVKYCKPMQKNLKKDIRLAKLLEGFCLLKVHRFVEAKNIFEKLLTKQNHKGLLQALYASTLLNLRELDLAKSVLNFIEQMDRKSVVIDTVLRGCLIAGDIGCSEKLISGSLKRYISPLYAYWGNAFIHIKKNPDKAKASIQSGLKISPHFAPLLKLKEKLK